MTSALEKYYVLVSPGVQYECTRVSMVDACLKLLIFRIYLVRADLLFACCMFMNATWKSAQLLPTQTHRLPISVNLAGYALPSKNRSRNESLPVQVYNGPFRNQGIDRARLAPLHLVPQT